MSQQEIINVLEKENKPLSLKEICEFLNETPLNRKISHALKQMIKYDEVKFFELDRNQAKKIFKEKAPFRRLKFYYIPKNKKIKK